MYAINFYSPVFADQLRKRRKTATIRLGDESDKYREGQVVWVTVGRRYGPRKKVFCAVLDSVDYKPLKELTRRDIERENPEFRSHSEVRDFLETLYDRPVVLDDMVTVIHFSDISEEPPPGEQFISDLESE